MPQDLRDRDPLLHRHVLLQHPQIQALSSRVDVRRHRKRLELDFIQKRRQVIVRDKLEMWVVRRYRFITALFAQRAPMSSAP